MVTFSGDKLLGGPQAGIILGRKDLVERFKKNPLTRALRVDKMTLAALEATLRWYRDECQALQHIPTLKMISLSLPQLEERAKKLTSRLQALDPDQRLEIQVASSSSQVGGGSLPGQDLPSYAVAIHSRLMSTQELERRLRLGDPPIIGRIESDRYLLDVRTLLEEDFALIEQAFCPVTPNGSSKRIVDCRISSTPERGRNGLAWGGLWQRSAMRSGIKTLPLLPAAPSLLRPIMTRGAQQTMEVASVIPAQGGNPCAWVICFSGFRLSPIVVKLRIL